MFCVFGLSWRSFWPRAHPFLEQVEIGEDLRCFFPGAWANWMDNAYTCKSSHMQGVKWLKHPAHSASIWQRCSRSSCSLYVYIYSQTGLSPLARWLLCFSTNSLSLVGNSGRLAQVRHRSRKGSATHSSQCVQYCRVSEQWHMIAVMGFLTCAQLF